MTGDERLPSVPPAEDYTGLWAPPGATITITANRGSEVLSFDLAERIERAVDDAAPAAHWWPPSPHTPQGVVGRGDFPLWEELALVACSRHARVLVIDDVHAFGSALDGEGWPGVSHTGLLGAIMEAGGRIENEGVMGDALVVWLANEEEDNDG